MSILGAAMSELKIYDLAVVGGGIAGLYCCLKSANHEEVALFEGTHRIGGKLETVPMEGFRAEYGAMRFDPIRQFRVGELIGELGLETDPFPEYSSPPGQMLSSGYGAAEREKGLSTLELLKLAIRSILQVSEEQLFSLSEEELGHFEREGKYQGEYLWNQGIWNVFSEVLSNDALKYLITDGSFFHFIHENPSAAGWMLTWVKMLQMSPALRGIKGGMQRLTDAMLDRAKLKGLKVYVGHVLQAIAPAPGNRVTLVFQNGESAVANRVILALPSWSLKTLKGLPARIRNLLDSVIEVPLLKSFIVVQKPWWKENIPNVGVTAVPARELHYYRHDDLGCIMLYADRPYINFWSKYISHDYHNQAELKGNQALQRMLAQQMHLNPRDIIAYGMRDWGRAPYGAACHLWRPGVQSWKIIEELTAFALNPGDRSNVHICGEAFSDYQGFMEGAVRTAYQVMTRIQG